MVVGSRPDEVIEFFLIYLTYQAALGPWVDSALVNKTEITAVGNRCADHTTPLYPQKLALTSSVSGGRSVGIVRSRIKATELLLFNKFL
jgi:hypothetical protein